MESTRTFTFELRSEHERVAGGSFSVQRTEGFSCFGSHQSAAPIGACLFSGVVIEHSLADDGSVSLALRLYEIEQTLDSPLGFRQNRVLKSAIVVGAESGEQGQESILLGKHHEFLFTSTTMA